MFDLKRYLAEKRRTVNAALDRLCGEADSPFRIVQAMRYSLLAEGKRLRPILCIAAAEAVGGGETHALIPACALEMIHTYSLIHDDLPAMDNDDLRRGRPTNHIQFDEATALLAGDALLTMAFEVLAEGAEQEGPDPTRRLKVIREIAVAAGCKGMIEGQMRDLAAEGLVLDATSLEAMHSLKTGALIRASVAAGAISGGADADRINALLHYADRIGLAFQVTDDLLNVEGDPLVMGKAVGTDRNRGKSTYPALMGLEGSRRFSHELIQEALAAISQFDDRSEPLRAIAGYILHRKR
ncbi:MULTISPECIES: polyprenyl synthetase family protein [Desulfococcus]|uniref:Polyprenyl synthetase n=1 Tax=Desulfococcus multivorans DSM 2059 TaxID=1121405 RepID=S7TPP1_DESML|nr:farnesyl diphosphate synthase [Desulfococcus multivorans]AOY57816.1 IspA: geranyltranstransferase (Farnesyl-diphosphate synthase) [Desulfococcus multivorans]AQV00201.1 farnesyl-diphosphate synthase [Desulfococcus multivorans]EPR38901.1 Polyprenyl synthetase [Desulfococcus multivorans DSM 2059]SJZ67661.1 farnesyl-diphosphate synthase [Desulfococcus multivorans DSM 2059]